MDTTTLTPTNPATGEELASYEMATKKEVEQVLTTATETFDSWNSRPLREREELLVAAAETLRENKQRYAALMTREMGKPLAQSEGEIEKCAWVCEHYAEHARRYLNLTAHPSPPGTAVETVYEPLGPVLAVMPWNFPFWQVFRFAAPALAAGNVCLLKHASNVPGSARAVADVFEEAGFPEGAFQTLLLSADRVDNVVADDRVVAATLTGSGPAGRAVAGTAGAELKPSVLELGGSDPFIVLEDAAIEAAVETGAWARLLNNGQSCIAAKRFILHEEIADEFSDQFVAEVESYTVGDPMERETDIGPQSAPEAVETLDRQVKATIDAGATVLTGGEPLDRDGAFYPPTVLTDIPADSPAASEELFGPVASLFTVESEQEAIELANDTQFGLGASIWTENRDRGKEVARQIDAGCVYINQLVKSDPRVPFGGIKESGYGRELAGEGIREFVNKKTVWVE